MEYRTLGRNGIRVSPLCLGTMTFGGATDEPTSLRIAHKAFHQGINFIDTADRYCEGRSEQIVGKIVDGKRDQWVLATKLGNPQGDGPNARGASRKHIPRAVEASLRRLRTDYIDILYVHHEDYLTPVPETVRALDDVVRQGKVRYAGVSNHRAWRISQFCHVADELNVARPAASQPCYNIANRQAEVEELSAACHYGLGVVSYSPLARGILTAKYDPAQAPPCDSRVGRRDRRIMETEWRRESFEVSDRIRRHAEARGITSGQFALAWVMNNALITSAIAGPRTEEQWDAYIPSLDYSFSGEDEAFVDGLVPPGHPSTPGFTDPLRPIDGRRPRSG